ncbi:MAG: ABC-F family ATP-binding cassette domain-containing protein [Bacteroidota bacterium]
MVIIQADNISKSYGEKLLFTEVTFSINLGDKIALIAPNGSGKTTLLNILIGVEVPETGNVIRKKDITVGFLRQLNPTEEEMSIKDYIYEAGTPVSDAIIAYNSSLLKYETSHNEIDQKDFQVATDKMDLLNAWNYELRFKEILGKFCINDLELKIKSLSGGQQKKIALAKLLSDEFDLLLLDEPTNHLDINMIEWLEEFLSKSAKTFITVTHDRYFLDNICSSIIEIDNQSIYSYNGDFAYFLEKKAEREQNQQKEIEKYKNIYRTELEWIRRQPKARGTKAKYRVDAFEDIKEIASRKIDKSSVQLDIHSTRMGNKIIEFKDVSFSYDTLPILDKFSYTFKKGEKLGIVGHNGTGKTTFLDLLTSKRKPDTGIIETGETISFGYYKQNDEIEQFAAYRVIDYAKEIAEQVALSDGRSISISQFLTRFLFSADAQYSPISKLSGGERKRLSLVKVLLKNPNFLILDEPTNDLDIQTLSILEDFLIEFRGCLVIVSHDRHFLDKIVDHIFVFEGSGNINDFHASYSQYRFEKKTNEKIKIQEEKVVIAKPATVLTNAVVKLSYKEQKELEDIDKLLIQLEQEKTSLTDELNNPNNSFEQITELSKKYSLIIEEIDNKTKRWFELNEKIG